MFIYTYIYVCVCMYVCMHVCICVETHSRGPRASANGWYHESRTIRSCSSLIWAMLDICWNAKPLFQRCRLQSGNVRVFMSYQTAPDERYFINCAPVKPHIPHQLEYVPNDTRIRLPHERHCKQAR